MPTFALLSDIHGNLPALEAVLADLGSRRVDQVITLGDLVSGPLWPAETAGFLMGQPWIQIAGNHERQMTTLPLDEQMPSDRFASVCISNRQRAWLADLPGRMTLEDGALLFHATPGHDNTYLLESVQGGQVHLSSPHEIAVRLGGVRAPLMLCGHSHMPRVLHVGGDLVVNPGSVGLQAYSDTRPEEHVLEVGSPMARYALLRGQTGAWLVDLVALPYDHDKASTRAARNGRPDWAVALRTGRMTG